MAVEVADTGKAVAADGADMGAAVGVTSGVVDLEVALGGELCPAHITDVGLLS